MKKFHFMRSAKMTALALMLTLSMSFVSQARAVTKDVPVNLQMDINSRQTSVYDGYTSYVMAYRAAEDDTFTVSAGSSDVNLKDVTMNYYVYTYNGETQRNLECTVHELEAGKHYPVIRPETVAREKESGDLYDTLERAYVIEFCRGEERTLIYFTILPEEEMQAYRNFQLGEWEKDSIGWKYYYKDAFLVSWAKIKDTWYLFGGDGYMLTGWQQFDGKWYYLQPSNGAMRSNCAVDGYELDGSGVRIGKK